MHTTVLHWTRCQPLRRIFLAHFTEEEKRYFARLNIHTQSKCMIILPSLEAVQNKSVYVWLLSSHINFVMVYTLYLLYNTRQVNTSRVLAMNAHAMYRAHTRIYQYWYSNKIILHDEYCQIATGTTVLKCIDLMLLLIRFRQ